MSEKLDLHSLVDSETVLNKKKLGRPKKLKEKSVLVSVGFRKDQIEALDSARGLASRSPFIRQALIDLKIIPE